MWKFNIFFSLILLTISNLNALELQIGADRYRYNSLTQKWDIYYSTYINLFSGNTNYITPSDLASATSSIVGMVPGSTFYVWADTTTGLNYDFTKSTMMISSATLQYLSVNSTTTLDGNFKVFIPTTTFLNWQASSNNKFVQFGSSGNPYGFHYLPYVYTGAVYERGSLYGFNLQRTSLSGANSNGTYGGLSKPYVFQMNGVSASETPSSFLITTVNGLNPTVTNPELTIFNNGVSGSDMGISMGMFATVGRYSNCSYIQTSGNVPLIFFFNGATSGTDKYKTPLVSITTQATLTIGSLSFSTSSNPNYPRSIIADQGIDANNYFRLGQSTSTLNPINYVTLRPTGTIGANDVWVSSPSSAGSTWETVAYTTNTSILISSNTRLTGRPVMATFVMARTSTTIDYSYGYTIYRIVVSAVFKSTASDQFKPIFHLSTSPTGSIISTTYTYSADSAWKYYSNTYTFNPFTTDKWKWNELLNLYHGVGMSHTSAGAFLLQIADVRMEVYYSSYPVLRFDKGKFGVGTDEVQDTLSIRGLGYPTSPSKNLFSVSINSKNDDNYNLFVTSQGITGIKPLSLNFLQITTPTFSGLLVPCSTDGDLYISTGTAKISDWRNSRTGLAPTGF